MGEGGQNYKINKTWECPVHHGHCSLQAISIAKSIDLKSSHRQKREFVTMYGDDVNQTYCDHFSVYVSIKSLYCTF